MSTSDSTSDCSSITLKGDDASDYATDASQTANFSWNKYFQEKLTLASSDKSRSFNVYFTPPKSPHDALFVFHHGAGSSGMSFAALVGQLTSLNSGYGYLSFDARLHGDSVVSSTATDPIDFGLQTLCRDFTETLDSLISQRFSGRSQPDLVLVGHSMGGAVVAHSAKSLKSLKRVIGLVVIDVVEGSAIDALRTMQTYLSTRPKSFPTIDAAVAWHIETGTIRNVNGAGLSVPPLLCQRVIDSSWIWKTNLLATQPYWPSWFSGLSQTFLSASSSKLLILAGTDRLDKPLMIAHMQGTYQLAVIPDAGHFVHEDDPARVATLLHEFVARFQTAHDVVRQARKKYRNAR